MSDNDLPSISSLGADLLGMLSESPEGGITRESIPDDLRGIALDECITFGYVEFVDNPLLVDAEQRYRDAERRNGYAPARFGRLLPDSDLRLLKITSKGRTFLDRKRPERTAAKGVPLPEVAKRLEQLRSQGEPFTSQPKLARQLGCSSATVNKAIRESPALCNWAKRPRAIPRSQSLTDVVTDRLAQSREPNPEDDAAIREYLERDLTPEERGFFLGLSYERQLDFLNDPDAHGLDEQVRIRGRRP